jgi:iron complex outermembrane recepter protein
MGMHFQRLGTTVLRTWAALLLLSWGARVTAQQPPADPPAEQPPTDAPESALEGTVDEAPAEEAPVEGESLGVEATGSESEVAAGTEDEAAPAGDADESGEIVVTGTRIKRTQSFALPAAIAVADRKELAASGANNMSDVLKHMTINYGSDFNLGLGTNAGGTAQFNLRGLGLSSTLVLLNGKRLVESGALSIEGATFVDVNALPLQAIERIEVLKGGASSIYGSDAVAGVVNVITRKRMDGFEAQVGGQATSDFKQHEWDMSLVGGAQGKTTRLMGMLSYFKREPLDASDREYTDNGVNISAQSYPSRYYPVNAAGVPTDAMGNPTAMPRFQVDPGCGTENGPLTMPAAMDPTLCRFNFNSYFDLVPTEQRLNMYVSAEQDIGLHAMAYFEAGYARTRASRSLSPSLQLNGATLFVPADHAWNPTGERLRLLGRVRGGAYPETRQKFDSDTLHTVAGIKGDFAGVAPDNRFGEWTWELSGTWSGTRFVTSATDTFESRLQTALDSCNPETPGYDPANCWNPFTFGPQNSEALTDQVMSFGQSITDRELTTLTADISGPLMALPGGDLSLAVGAQIRRQTIIYNPDHLSRAGEHPFSGSLQPYSAARRIVAGYGELSAPFLEGLEVQAAARLEHYQDAGSSGLNPMLGVTWTPAVTFLGPTAPQPSRVRVRGTFATSFVAPSQLQTSGVLNAPTALQNAVPNETMPGMFMLQAPNFLNVRTESNPNLKPQKSTAITAGLEWTPLKGLLVALDYWNYSFTDIIFPENAQQLIIADYMAQTDSRILRQGGIPQQVTLKFDNRKEVTTQGLDVDATFRNDLGDAGALSVGLNVSYVLSYNIPLGDFGAPRAASPDADCDGETCNVAGLRNGTNFARSIPRMRMTIPVSWTIGAHQATLIGHLISAYKDDAIAPGATAASPMVDIGGQFTLDLQYALKIAEGEDAATTLKVGVNNLFNAEPPKVATANLGYDTETHDPRGRLIYARLIQEL